MPYHAVHTVLSAQSRLIESTMQPVLPLRLRAILSEAPDYPPQGLSGSLCMCPLVVLCLSWSELHHQTQVILKVRGFLSISFFPLFSCFWDNSNFNGSCPEICHHHLVDVSLGSIEDKWELVANFLIAVTRQNDSFEKWCSVYLTQKSEQFISARQGWSSVLAEPAQPHPEYLWAPLADAKEWQAYSNRTSSGISLGCLGWSLHYSQEHWAQEEPGPLRYLERTVFKASHEA